MNNELKTAKSLLIFACAVQKFCITFRIFSNVSALPVSPKTPIPVKTKTPPALGLAGQVKRYALTSCVEQFS